MRVSYQEGTTFAIPLREGGWGIGVAARVRAERKVILAYFFGPKRNDIPKFETLKLRSEDAIKIARVGDLSLIDGSWPIIGIIKPWKSKEWPIPLMARCDDIFKKAWLTQYSETDITQLESETEISYAKASEFLSNSLLGAGAAEILLTRLLK